MKKGFTLIELLAVIVILAIIALIAVPTITGIVERAKKGGAESSALGWIDAVEKQAMLNELSESNKIDLNSRYNVSELISMGVKVKGETPRSGYVTLTNGKVSTSTLCIGNYKVVVEDNKVKSSTKENNCTVDSIYPRYVYSRVNGATHVGYPIDAGIVLNNKVVMNFNNINYVFNSIEECNAANPPFECVTQNFTTPNLEYKTSPDVSWDFYLKHTLNSNGIIEEIDVCGKYEGQELCLERSEDGSKFEQNKSSMSHFFGGDNCRETQAHYPNGTSNLAFVCHVDSIRANVQTNGGVAFVSDGNECSIFGSGTAACSINLELSS